MNSFPNSHNWRVLKIKESSSLNTSGVLNSVLTPLAEAKIGIFSMSTFDSDIILFQQDDYENVIKALSANLIIND